MTDDHGTAGEILHSLNNDPLLISLQFTTSGVIAFGVNGSLSKQQGLHLLFDFAYKALEVLPKASEEELREVEALQASWKLDRAKRRGATND